MKADTNPPTKRWAKRLIPSTFPLVASVVLLACAACHGFFVDPTLSSLQVNPTGATILIGGTVKYTATATYDDGSTQTVTPTWASTPAATATISSAGLATGVAAGTATITAVSHGVTGTTTLLVQRTAKSISVTPANLSISATQTGTIQQYTATATFSDGTSVDVTSSSTWISSVPTVATIVGSTGAATIVATGKTVIQANYGGASGSTGLTVQ